MPYTIKKVSSSDKPFKIINKLTKKLVGASVSKAKAKAAIRARMSAEKGKYV